MADEYVMLVKKHRPEGPYLLGGVSFGGLLAYEMAQILVTRGEEVKLLALFDTILPRALEDVPWLTRARAKMGRLRGGSDALLGVLRRGAQKLGERVQKVAREASASQEMEALATRDAVLKDAAERYDQVVRAHSGRVMVFRAREGLGDGGERVRWDLGWTGLLRANTPMHGVADDHLGILRDPGVGEVAATIRSILSRNGRAPQ